MKSHDLFAPFGEWCIHRFASSVLWAAVISIMVTAPSWAGASGVTPPVVPTTAPYAPVRLLTGAQRFTIVMRDGTGGYMDRFGKVALLPGQGAARFIPENFRDGYAVVHEISDVDVVIDVNGNVVHRETDALINLGAGKFAIRGADAVQFFDLDGLLRAKQRITSWGASFSEATLPVAVDEKWGVLDERGHVVIPARFQYIQSFSENLAAARFDGKWGYIDHLGNWVIPPRFDSATSFSHGLAVVAVHDRLRYIDPEGRFAFETHYLRARSFSEGLAAVEEILPGETAKLSDNRVAFHPMGFVDRTGRYSILPRFVWAGPFSEGLAAALTETEAGYIDHTGKFVVHIDDRLPGDFGGAGHGGQLPPDPGYGEFKDGLALINTARGTAYIDRAGREVWREPTNGKQRQQRQ